MIPLFKSCHSIGKSILTLSDPEKDKDDGSDSIFTILIESKKKELYLVEDSMSGFFEAYRRCKELDIQLIFGYRFTCCNSLENKESNHKLIAFAKNDQGCKDLNKFYTYINTKCEGRISNEDLLNIWTDDMFLAVPFYDSFIFNNQLHLGNCIPNFGKIQPTFFVEHNGLPFDNLVEKAVRDYNAGQFNIELTKSIYYRYRDDCEALQTYKILCNRSFGRQATLSSPNLNHFGSNEFCWESFLEYENFTP